MFIRYLGGGIGHLEQFTPADGDAIADNGDSIEIETDDFIIGNTNNDGDGGERDREVEENEDEENEEEEESEDEEGDDPGESSDEEMGNVY